MPQLYLSSIMKSIYVLTVPLLIACAAHSAEPEATAAEPTVAAAAPLPEQPQHPGAKHLELAMEAITICEELGAVLQSVTDWSSANKAAPQTEQLANRLAELSSKVRELPAPTPEIQHYVSEKLAEVNAEEVSERSLGKLIDLMTLIDPPCYGSEELTKALQRIANRLMGAE